jgi:hypothetical protein
MAAAINKENVQAHHGGELGELPDPFGGCSNPYQPHQPRVPTAPVSNSLGGLNPYQKQSHRIHNNTAPSRSFTRTISSSNPQQKQLSYNKQNNAVLMHGRAPPGYPNNMARSLPPANNSSTTSPTLTLEQKRRMEENRQQALAIRTKRQQQG